MRNESISDTEEISSLSPKDEGARRVASLALELINARRPLDAAYLRSHIYPELGQASFLIAIARDCDRLALCGIHVVKGKDATWQIDEKSSYVSDATLARSEALELQTLLSPLVENEGFAWRDELRLALLKIDRSFDAEPLVQISSVPKAPSRAGTILRSAYAAHSLVELAYTDAAGKESTKVLAPYGFFSLHGMAYCVAAEAADGELASPKTYRISRMKKPRMLKGGTFEIPDDFDIEEFIHLPFQIGPAKGIGSFRAKRPAQDLLSLMKAQGRVRAEEAGSFVWEVPVASWEDAASWGIAEGLLALAPAELRDAAKKCLEGTVADV